MRMQGIPKMTPNTNSVSFTAADSSPQNAAATAAPAERSKGYGMYTACYRIHGVYHKEVRKREW